MICKVLFFVCFYCLSHLCVEDPLVCTDDVLVTEEQVEVLEGLCQEEGLLHIVLDSPNLENGDLDQNPDFFREMVKQTKITWQVLRWRKKLNFTFQIW